MRRIWPPGPEPEQPLVLSDQVALHDWCARFEVTLQDADTARSFAGQYRLKFQSSAATATDQTAWVTFRTGAADERDAGLLAAVTVKIVADLPLVKTVPLGAKLHYTDDMGTIPAFDQNRRRAEREALLDYARLLDAARQLSAPRGARLDAAPPRRSHGEGTGTTPLLHRGGHVGALEH